MHVRVCLGLQQRQESASWRRCQHVETNTWRRSRCSPHRTCTAGCPLAWSALTSSSVGPRPACIEGLGEAASPLGPSQVPLWAHIGSHELLFNIPTMRILSTRCQLLCKCMSTRKQRMTSKQWIDKDATAHKGKWGSPQRENRAVRKGKIGPKMGPYIGKAL